jgi:diguanylate cyclase (GGDEF)-like protein
MLEENASVLLVDGDADAQSVVSTVLQRRGFRVTQANCGETAITLLESGASFNLVLLNLSLPDIPGIEVLARIRARNSITKLPVIVFVDEASNEILFQSMELGANEMLGKPLNLSLLVSRIEMQLRIRGLFEEIEMRHEKTRSTLDAIPDLIFRCSADDCFLDVSSVPEERSLHLGHMEAGMAMRAVLPRWILDVLHDFRARKPSEGKIDVRRQSVPQTGGDKVFEIRLIACRDGETVCVVRNVTREAEFEAQLRALASTDALTRVANRRQFDETLLSEWRRGIRSKSPFAVAIADVDFFKPYNDHFGHLGGDDCLRKVAAAIQGVLQRPGDFLARYGGEEFAVVMPDTDETGARFVADRIREAIERLGMEHPKSPLGIVTISIGIASMIPKKDVEPTRVLQIADGHLYAAKKAGRNRVQGSETVK